MPEENIYDNFPKRPKQHINESASVKIFERKMPQNWVIRSVTERDYGIDLFVEIVKDEKMTGKLLTCQLKSVDEIVSNLTCYDIKSSTFRYWYALPTTTFVFLVDIKNQEVYYYNVKEYIRQNYSDFKEGKLNKIKFNNDLSLSKLSEKEIENRIIKEYNKENSLKHIETQMISFLLNLEKNLNILDSHLYRDSFLSLSDEGYDDWEYIMMYQQFKELMEYFDKPWDVKDLNEFYREGREMFPDYNAEVFFEAQAQEMSKCLIPKLIDLYRLISEYINKNNVYWSTEYAYINIFFIKKYEYLWELIIEKKKYYDFLSDK